MNILITGGKGNLATIIHSHLSGKYTIVNPSHQELDLLDFNQVDRFLKDKLFQGGPSQLQARKLAGILCQYLKLSH